MFKHSAIGQRTSGFLGAVIITQMTLAFGPALADQAAGEASYLFDRLLGSDAERQVDIVHQLEEMGAAAVPSLVSAAGSSDRFHRHQAIEILGRLGKDADAATPDLIAALGDAEPQIRRNAAWALGRVGHGASDATPALLSAAHDAEWDVRADAVWAVGKVASREPTAVTVTAMIGALDDPSHHVRWSAVWSLARFGTKAEAAIPALVKRLQDPSPKLRASAAVALARIATRDHEDLIVPALTLAKDDESRTVRTRAVAALRSLKSGAAAPGM